MLNKYANITEISFISAKNVSLRGKITAHAKFNITKRREYRI